MNTEITNKGSHTVVSPDGKLDAFSSEQLETQIVKLIDGGVQRMIMDLSNVSFVSSAGLRVLLLATQKLRGQGRFALCGMNPYVTEVIEMVGFHNLIEIFPDLDQAEIAMSQTQP